MDQKKVIANAISQKLTVDAEKGSTVTVTNRGANPVYLGNDSVTAADGFELMPAVERTFNTNGSHLYVVSDSVAPPAAAPTAAASGGGTLPDGGHAFVETYVNAAGETTPSLPVLQATTAPNSTVTVTGAALPAGVSQANVYMQSSGSADFLFVGSRVAGLTTVVSAPAAVGAAKAPKVNTAGITSEVRSLET